MAYYFFTELDKLNDQNTNGNGEAYGPTSVANGKDRFRVASTHKVSTDAKVIAVCKGTILVQEQYGNSDLLNIILKPFEQPPFEFPKIKYFIYRGVKKSSIVSGTNIVAKTTTTLTDNLWTDYNAFNSLNNQAPPYQLLGLGMNTANTPFRNEDLLENIFPQTVTDQQLPTVQAGWHIANFDHTVNIGFEIMFESLGFEPTLGITRKVENIVEITSLTSAPTQADFFEHWHDKEDILNYIDPCAFWGSFYSKNLIVFNNGNKNKKKANELYTDVLSLFLNKNKCYLDLRNEFNFSLNYFKNYGTNSTNNTTNIKLGKGTNPVNSIDYYNNGWPILVIDNTGFSTTTNNYQELSLQLPCGNGDNPAPLIYFDKAYQSNKKFPNEHRLKNKFVTLEVDEDYTYKFAFSLPYIDCTYLMSSYTRVMFCKRYTRVGFPTTSSESVIRRSEDFFSLFDFRSIMRKTSSNAIFKTCTFDDNYYFDTEDRKGINNIGISMFDDKVCFFSLLKNSFKNTSCNLGISSKYSKISSEGIFEEIAKRASSFFKTELELDLTDLLNGEKHKIHSFESVDIEDNFFKTKLSDLRHFSFSSNKLSEIKNLVDTSFESKYPVFIGINYEQSASDKRNLYYNASKISLTGFTESSGVLSVNTIDTGIQQFDINLIEANRLAILNFNVETINRGFEIVDNGLLNGIPIKSINCKIFLSQGPGVSNEEFDDMADYVEANIKQVWNSQTNKGVSHWRRTNNGQKVEVLLSSSGIVVDKTTCPDPASIGANEIYFQILKQSAALERSFAKLKGKTGTLFINRNYNAAIGGMPCDVNTPAHEFGHILGLEDRYQTVIGINSQQTQILLPVNIRHIPIYIKSYSNNENDSYDWEYSTHFRWIHNIMNNKLNIEPVNFRTFSLELPASIGSSTLYNTLMSVGYQNQNRVEDYFSERINPVNPITNYSKVSVIITTKQLSIIFEDQKEDSKIDSYSDIRRIMIFTTTINNFFGTFIGLKRDVNPKICVTDARPFETGNGRLLENFTTNNQALSEMEDRIYRRNEAFREDRFPVTDYGNWFAPYDYSPKIDILSFQNQLQIDNVILGGKLQNINNFLNLANPPIEPVGLTYNPEAFEANSGSNFSASGAAIWNLYGNSYANEIFIVSNAFLNSIKEGVTGRPLLRIPYNNTIICVVFRFYKNRSIIMERWS